MGGYLSFTTSYKANQLMNKKQISGHLEGKELGAVSNANIAGSLKDSMRSNNVEVTNSVRTNTFLPAAACGDLVVNENYNPNKTLASCFVGRGVLLGAVERNDRLSGHWVALRA